MVVSDRRQLEQKWGTKEYVAEYGYVTVYTSRFHQKHVQLPDGFDKRSKKEKTKASESHLFHLGKRTSEKETNRACPVTALVLTLSRPGRRGGGGGAIPPTMTFNLNNVFKEQTAFNLRTFSEIHLGKMWCGRLVLIDFDVTMGTNLPSSFSENGKSLFKMKMRWYWLLFFQLRHLGKSRNPRWWIQHGRHLAIMKWLWRHMTSSLLVVDFKGNVFGRTIYPPSLIIIVTPPAPKAEKEKKQKVWIGLRGPLFTWYGVS